MAREQRPGQRKKCEQDKTKNKRTKAKRPTQGVRPSSSATHTRTRGCLLPPPNESASQVVPPHKTSHAQHHIKATPTAPPPRPSHNKEGVPTSPAASTLPTRLKHRQRQGVPSPLPRPWGCVQSAADDGTPAAATNIQQQDSGVFVATQGDGRLSAGAAAACRRAQPDHLATKGWPVAVSLG